MDQYLTQIERSCFVDYFEEYLFADIGTKNAFVAAGLSCE
jgi:hypothetical protein